MAIELNISAKDAEESGSVAARIIPEGDYDVVAIKVEDKRTNDQTGRYLAVMFQVVDGDYAGAKLFNNYNYVNKSEIAVKIAINALQAWCIQAGLAKDGEKFALDHTMLVGTQIKVHVTVEDRKAYTDPKTGKEHPAKKENRVSILPPSKAGVTAEPTKVDKSESWT